MVVRSVSRLWFCVLLVLASCPDVFGVDEPPAASDESVTIPPQSSFGIPYPGSDDLPDRLTLPSRPRVQPTTPTVDVDDLWPAVAESGPRGEFTTQQALLLAWVPFNEEARPVQIEIARLSCATTPVIVIAPDEEGVADALNAFTATGVPLENVTFLASPLNTPWIRDYGPFAVRGQDGLLKLIDAPYGDDRLLDDGVPARLGLHLELPVVDTSLIVEGGNLLTNGEGLLVCSTRMISENQGQGFTLKEIRSRLLEQWHVRDAVFVDPIVGESTGHVDMLMTFPAQDTVIVGEYDDASGDVFNRRLLNETAERLASVRLSANRNLKVVRIPMPPQPEAEFWPSYCNVVYANGVLLVPFYSEEDDSFRRAVEVYRRVLPGWRIAGIDCSEIIRTGGALHCLTTTITADLRLNEKPFFRGRRLVRVPATLRPELRWGPDSLPRSR